MNKYGRTSNIGAACQRQILFMSFKNTRNPSFFKKNWCLIRSVFGKFIKETDTNRDWYTREFTLIIFETIKLKFWELWQLSDYLNAIPKKRELTKRKIFKPLFTKKKDYNRSTKCCYQPDKARKMRGFFVSMIILLLNAII